MPTFCSLLNVFFNMSELHLLYISFGLTFLLSSPFLLFLLTKHPFGLSLLYCLSGISLTWYIFFYHEELKYVLLPLLPLSILVIIDYPEIFRFISILFAFNIYPLTVESDARSAYVGLSIFFYIVSENYIKNVNYFQNRQGHDLKLWYFGLIFVHIIEIFNDQWFEIIRILFIFTSFIGLWI